MVSFTDRADTQYLLSQGETYTSAFAILKRDATNPYASDPSFIAAQEQTQAQFEAEQAAQLEAQQEAERQRQLELQRLAEEEEAARLLEEPQTPSPEDPISVPQDPIDEGVPLVDGGDLGEMETIVQSPQPIDEFSFFGPPRAPSPQRRSRRTVRSVGSGNFATRLFPTAGERASPKKIRSGGVSFPTIDSIFQLPTSQQKSFGISQPLEFTAESLFGTRRTRRTTRRTQQQDPTDVFFRL